MFKYQTPSSARSSSASLAGDFEQREASLPPSRSSSVCSCLSCYPSTLAGLDPRQSSKSRRSSDVIEYCNIDKYYRFDQVLGEGTFSVVYLAESKEEEGAYVAVKVIEKSVLRQPDGEDLTWLVDKELDILSCLDHPHIVHLNEVYNDDNSACLVMELAKGGEVFDRLLEQGQFNEATAAALCVQVLNALDYLHSQGIVHRDLKPENLLYYDDAEDSKILLADFGLSEYVWALSEDTPICGTPGYMAPEVISERLVTPAADIWSIGVIAYVLLAGYPPFVSKNKENDSELLSLIASGKYSFPEKTWRHISPEAKDFVRKLMCPSPVDRLSCQEALSHPWLRNSQVVQDSPEKTLAHVIKKIQTNWARLVTVFVLAAVYMAVVAYFFQLDWLSSI